jgi:HK97 family phage major capsid protein
MARAARMGITSPRRREENPALVRKHNYSRGRTDEVWRRAMAAVAPPSHVGGEDAGDPDGQDGEDHGPHFGVHTHYHLHPDGGVAGLDSQGGHSHNHQHGVNNETGSHWDNDHDEHEHDEPDAAPRPSTPPNPWEPAHERQNSRYVKHIRFQKGGLSVVNQVRQQQRVQDAVRALDARGGGIPARRPPGARLDGRPWAKSWGALIAAIDSDPAARKAISNAAMGERIPAEGGFLVPEYLAQQVRLYVEESIVWPRASIFPMSSLRLRVPVVDNTSEASSAGVLGGMTFAITKEGAAITASTAGLSNVTLEARKLAGLLQEVPNELVSDGGAAFDSFIGPAVGRAMAWALDDLFLSTSGGANSPEGVINAACAVAVSRGTGGDVTLADVANMWERLAAPSMQSGNAIWLASPKVVQQLALLSQTVSTTPIPASSFFLGTGPNGGWYLGGIELIITSHLSDLGTAGDLVLADFSQYAIGDRQALQVARSDEGEGFINDTSDFKFTTRIDGRWLLRSAISPSDGSQTTSPVVVLH